MTSQSTNPTLKENTHFYLYSILLHSFPFLFFFFFYPCPKIYSFSLFFFFFFWLLVIKVKGNLILKLYYIGKRRPFFYEVKGRTLILNSFMYVHFYYTVSMATVITNKPCTDCSKLITRPTVGSILLFK